MCGPDPNNSVFVVKREWLTQCTNPASAEELLAQMRRFEDPFLEKEIEFLQKQKNVLEIKMNDLINQRHEIRENITLLQGQNNVLTQVHADPGFAVITHIGEKEYNEGVIRAVKQKKVSNSNHAVVHHIDWEQVERNNQDISKLNHDELQKTNCLMLYQQELDNINNRLEEIQHQSPLASRIYKLKQMTSGPKLSEPFDDCAAAPTGPNVLGGSIRFFRLLVWNLENFTRDPRPRGTSSPKSLRNKARIAIVTRLAHELGIDALLVMETGSDVGMAMTEIAKQWQLLENTLEKPRQLHPLVSAATHAIPDIELDYLEFETGKPTGDKVLALRTLSEVFEIQPSLKAQVNSDVTQQQIIDAVNVLWEASSAVKALEELPLSVQSNLHLLNNSFVVGHQLLNKIHQIILGINDYDGQRDCITKTLENLYSTQLPFNNLILIQNICNAILYARNIRMHLIHADQEDDSLTPCGALELAELAFMFALKAYKTISLDEMQEPIWNSRHIYPATSLPLFSFCMTGIGLIDLRSIDQILGPIESSRDGEFILSALRKLDIIKCNSETYGVIYRPHSPEHIEKLFNTPCFDMGYSEQAYYGILKYQCQANGHVLVSQVPEGLLKGRSALNITFPVNLQHKTSLPCVLHHNRFTGTDVIKKMDRRFTAEENIIMARCLTLEDLANAQDPSNPPLIVGDFNIPKLFLEVEDEPQNKKSKKPWERRKTIREQHHKELLKCGYIRSSIDKTYPLTTLKGYKSLASDVKNPLNETYDALYQPFDFMRGTALARNAVLNQEKLADFLLKVIQDDSTVWDTFRDELVRIYGAILLKIVTKIERCEDWFKLKIERKDYDYTNNKITNSLNEFSKNLDAHRNTCKNLIAAYDTLLKSGWNVNPTENRPLFDFFSEIETHLNNITNIRYVPESMIKLKKDLKEIYTQLQHMEQCPITRFWIAYKAVVSDHLPQVVEVDYSPLEQLPPLQPLVDSSSMHQ